MPKQASLTPDWILRSRLKMRHVLLLVAIDEHRSIHKAATGMNITQPAATKLLADLEKLLALRLFERSTRGLVPTPHGESLVRHARTILGTLDHARSELGAISDGAAGKIKIGVLLVVAPVLVPRALLRLKERHPTMTVLVQEGNLASLLPALHRGDLDLVVGRLTTDFDSAGLHFEFCYEEPMCVVVRRGHPLCGAAAPTLAELAGESWILPTPDAAYRQRIDAAFRQEGVEPPARLVESVSILTNKALLQGSDMLGVMPLNVARHYESRGELATLPVTLPMPSGPVGIITRSAAAATSAQLDLLDAIRSVAREIDGG
jgi:DNA-binding transcriptional LysR family regulator